MSPVMNVTAFNETFQLFAQIDLFGQGMVIMLIGLAIAVAYILGGTDYINFSLACTTMFWSFFVIVNMMKDEFPMEANAMLVFAVLSSMITFTYVMAGTRPFEAFKKARSYISSKIDEMKDLGKE